MTSTRNALGALTYFNVPSTSSIPIPFGAEAARLYGRVVAVVPVARPVVPREGR